MKAIIKSDIKELNTEIELDDEWTGHFYNKVDDLFTQRTCSGHNMFLRIKDETSENQDIWGGALIPGKSYVLSYCCFLDVDITEWPIKNVATLIIEE